MDYEIGLVQVKTICLIKKRNGKIETILKSEILKKEEDIRTLTNENNRLNAEIKRKEKGFEDQINEVNIKLKNCEEDLLKRPTKTVYVDRVK